MQKLWIVALLIVGGALGVLIYKGKTTLDLPVTFNPEPASGVKADACAPHVDVIKKS